MKKIYCLLSFVLCLSGVFGQNDHHIDSLKNILKTLPELNGTDRDTTRMKVVMEIAKIYEKTELDSALFWYMSSSDTIVDLEKINQYKSKAKLNARILRNIGSLYNKSENYTSAILYFEPSLRIYEELGDDASIAACLNLLGNACYYLGRFSAATSCYSRSLKIYEKLGDKNKIAINLSNLGNVEKFQCNYASALSFYERSLKINNDIGDSIGISISLDNIGNIETDKGNYISAISYYERSLIISEGMGYLEGISSSINNLGNVYLTIGNYPEAISYTERSMKLNEELEEKYGLSYNLMNLGIIETYQGRYSSAISYFERSQKLFNEIGNKMGISSCMLNLGAIAYFQGNYPSAFIYFEQSMKLSEELGDKVGVSMCLNNIAGIEKEQGRYSSAFSYFEQSLKISEEISDKKGISACWMNLGIIAEKQGNDSLGILYYTRSLRIKEEMGDLDGISMCLNNLGCYEKDHGNYSSSIDYFERSLKINEEMGKKAELARNYQSLIEVYLKTGEIALAPTLLMKSLDISLWLLKDNFSIMSENEKELYFEVNKSVFNALNAFNITYPGYDDSIPGICFNNELILKGLLLKSTAGIMDVVYNSPDTALQSTYWSMKQYRVQISSLQGTNEANRDSMIADLEKKANEQERKLVKMSSEFADIQNLFNYRWEDVRKNLKSNEAAIEFVSFTQGVNRDTTVYAALIITAESKMPVSVKLFEDGELQKILGKSTGAGYNYVKSLYGENNTALYKLIWKPLESALAGINTVYYAPVGVLNKISFAAMFVESGKMLSDVYMLHQVSTTGKLINKDEAKELKMTAAVFGGIDYNPDSLKLETWNYLPGTLNEKNSIENQLKKNKITCLSYSGKEAKEETFKALFDSTDAPSVLHISTHGFFFPDPEVKQSEKQNENEEKQVVFRGSSGFGNWMFVNNKNPMMRSGLVFAGANRVWNEEWGKTDNEGVLTAYEVSNMNMRNTDLVVLSACETGLGDIKGSEGVYGLQRAFKMAGVKYIIMSLWQVPDKETVEFMELFYKKLLKSKDVRKSFNETQKEMRKKYDPYYWAAFVLVE